MNHWAALAFVRFTLALVLGILLYLYLLPPANGWAYLFVALSLGYMALYVALPPARRRGAAVWLGGLALAGVAVFGAALTHWHTRYLHEGHLLHLPDTVRYYEAQIDSDLREKPRTYAATVAIARVFDGKRWQPTEGRAMLYFARTDSTSATLRYGSRVLVKGRPDTLAPPLNPDAFDYRAYLARQQVYHQQYVPPGSFKLLGHSPPNVLIALAIDLKNQASNVLRRYIASPQEAGLAVALVLGVKDYLDNDIVAAYSATGTMHVLAVSGMHVAILFTIYTFLFTWLEKRKPYGPWAFALLALCLFWLYALITGWSASVLRATVMFSLIVLARAWGRRTSIFNTLACSAFVLLCYNPYLLFDVGFQLSYLAVIGIVAIYPHLYRQLNFTNRIADWLWSVTCVSIAAQLATSPLCILYFHQFPNYFLISNPPVIFLGTVALLGGILLLAVAWLPLVPVWLGHALKWVIVLLNQVTFALEGLPYAVWEGLHIGLWEALALYALLVLLALCLLRYQLRYLKAALGLAVLLLAWQVYEYAQQGRQAQWVVYHAPRQSVVGLLHGHRATLWADSALLYHPTQLRYTVQNHWDGRGILPSQIAFRALADTLPAPSLAERASGVYRLLVFKGKKLLLLYGKPQRRPLPPADVLVLCARSVRHLNELGGASYSQLVIDASFSAYRAQQLAAQARERGWPCHSVAQQGAFVMDIPSPKNE